MLQLGVSAFFAEISSAVITIIFNMLILRIAGNIGIAAYGVVANISLVAMAILNGLAQGAQPLISQSYGKGEHDLVRKFLNWSLAAALLIELVIVVLIYGLRIPLSVSLTANIISSCLLTPILVLGFISWAF